MIHHFSEAWSIPITSSFVPILYNFLQCVYISDQDGLELFLGRSFQPLRSNSGLEMNIGNHNARKYDNSADETTWRNQI